MSLQNINVCQCIETLGAHLELLHDAAALNSTEVSAKRKIIVQLRDHFLRMIRCCTRFLVGLISLGGSVHSH